MGKKGSSWFRAVKRAFGSPSKDSDSKKCRRHHSSSKAEAEQVSEAKEEKKEKEKRKRKWVFGKSSYFEDHQEKSSSDNEKHAIALVSCPASPARPIHSWAAIRIQTTFRAYLARRALRALRGLVRLQALVRGYNVRKQTNATLRCMQALVRVQARVRDRRLLLSQPRQEATETNSVSQHDWDDRTRVHAVDKQNKQEAAAKRERALAYAFSHQLRKSGAKQGASTFLEGQTDKGHWGLSWLERWMAARPWESTSVEKDCKSANDIAIKTVQVDRGRSYSQPQYASPARRSHHSPASAKTICTPAPRRSSSPSPSPSPRSCGRHSIYNQEIPIPSLSTGTKLGSRRTSINDDFNSIANSPAVPNYMAATESARAKARSQSAPRHRPETLEKERWSCVKKRLSFPAVDANSSTMPQRSPSLKGIPGPIKIERSNTSFTESNNGDETTPSSIGDLRKWLR